MQRLIELTRDVELPSLQRVGTRATSLYVMQNAYGLIKVGRSADPDARRSKVQREARCPVAIIAVFPEAGHFEEWIHIQLRSFQLVKEWFSGSVQAREQIDALFDVRFAWQYGLAETLASAWVVRMENGAADQYRRTRQRLAIRKLTVAATERVTYRHEDYASRLLDSDIELGLGAACIAHRDGLVRAHYPKDDSPREVPRYTSSMEVAQTLWLPDVPEVNFRRARTAVECCLGALCDRWGFDLDRRKP